MLGNTAGFGGGAFLINNPSKAQIANSTFSGNVATLEGGAMVSTTCNCQTSAADWIINSTVFINNTAGDLSWHGNGTMLNGKSYGGAISFASNNKIFISEGSYFINNQASLGGAIFGIRLTNFFVGQ